MRASARLRGALSRNLQLLALLDIVTRKVIRMADRFDGRMEMAGDPGEAVSTFDHVMRAISSAGWLRFRNRGGSAGNRRGGSGRSRTRDLDFLADPELRQGNPRIRIGQGFQRNTMRFGNLIGNVAVLDLVRLGAAGDRSLRRLRENGGGNRGRYGWRDVGRRRTGHWATCRSGTRGGVGSGAIGGGRGEVGVGVAWQVAEPTAGCGSYASISAGRVGFSGLIDLVLFIAADKEQSKKHRQMRGNDEAGEMEGGLVAGPCRVQQR